jgi:hypothetical protein
MNKHVASVHEEIRKSKCNICDHRCSQNSTLNSHVASVHEAA